jgi:predicted ATPase/DNA-binding XRE family transcriptional regulator
VRLEAEGFGGQLRRHRVLAGLSQEALAERAGLSRRGIADLERGARRFPYPDTALRLANALELTGADRKTFFAACRPSASRWSKRYLLPIQPSVLVGREDELAALKALITNTRLLTLTGTAGIGKTRVALALAHQLEPQYADGAAFVDLAPVVDLDLVPHAVAAALDISGKPAESLTSSVREHLRAKNLLIILDNCEHVVAACAELTDMLIRSCSDVDVVTTSREALRIHGETVWTVPPLGSDEAVELFERRAQAAAAAMPLETDNVDAIRWICVRLEGIPLAIELAAVRVPALGVTRVADLLADRLDLLSRGSRLDSPRHQTLRAALDWSYALLNRAEQRLFERLAAFAGGWDLEAANTVCAWNELTSHDVLESLVSLVDKSLVLVEDIEGQRRYRFLETIREYAAQRLETSAEGDPTHNRHASHFLSIAQAAASTRLGIRYPRDAELVRRELANMRAALRWLLDQDQLEEGLELSLALSGFWLSHGFLLEGEEWLARFLARPDAVSSDALAQGLYAWGKLAEYGGALGHARELFERSLSTSIAAGNSSVSARALWGLGDVALHHGGYVDALGLYRRGLDAARTAGSAQDTAQALLCLGRAASMLGDLQQSRTWMEEALTIGRQLEDRWSVAYVLNELGQQARRTGQLEQAQAILEECHVLWRQSGTRMGERAAIMNLALVNLDRGGLTRSAELARESLELSQDMRDDKSATTVRCVEIAAQVLGALGATHTVVTLLASATTRREALDAPRPSVEQPELDRVLAAARTELGTSTFETAWRHGEDLAIHDAIDQAAATLTTLLETSSF